MGSLLLDKLRTVSIHTLKKLAVEPPFLAPYLMTCGFWLANSSTLRKATDFPSTVRKAARLAVYEETMIRVKNHQIPAAMRVDTALETKNKITRIVLDSVNSSDIASTSTDALTESITKEGGAYS